MRHPRPIFIAPVGGRHGLLALTGAIFGLGLAAGTALEQAVPLHAPSISSAFSDARLAARPSAANASFPLDGERAYPADVLRVIDGDTFAARVHVGWGLDFDTKVRLRNIDAPELHARCARELRKALAARVALQTMLASGGVVISRVGIDKYPGRIDALVTTRDVADVSTALLRSGFARRYAGGRRLPWC